MFRSKFKSYTFLLIFCSLCLYVNSEDTKPKDTATDTCILEDKDKKELSLELLQKIRDDSATPQDLLRQNVTAGADVKTVSVQFTPNNEGKSKYVKVHLDDTSRKFQLMLDEDFKNYEENENSTEMLIEVILNCGINFRIRKFKLPIEDTNNHAPEFLNEPYEFELPIPFPKNRELMPFGKSGLQNIVARDYDLTNTEVTFSFIKSNDNSTENTTELFSIGWNKQKVGKLYTAVLKSAKDLFFDKEINLLVQATDNGKPAKNSTKPATIKITPIKAENVPKFSSDFFSVTCAECKTSDKAVIIPFKPEIKLLNLGNDQPKIDVQSTVKELKNAFTAEIKNSTVQMSLKLPANFKDDYIFVTVTASLPAGETKAFAHIVLPRSQPEVEESSCGGLIAATVILSILLIGLLIGAAYYYNKLR